MNGHPSRPHYYSNYRVRTGYGMSATERPIHHHQHHHYIGAHSYALGRRRSYHTDHLHITHPNGAYEYRRGMTRTVSGRWVP